MESGGSTDPLRPEKRPSSPSVDQVAFWCELPEELIFRILSWLPLPDICRLRAVCRRWSECLSPAKFASIHSQVPGDWHNLLAFTGSRQLNCFLPSLKKWYRIPLPFVSYYRRCLAASGSLLCMIKDMDLYVCNPMARTLTRLPRMLSILYPLNVGMVVDPVAQAYRIVVVGSSSNSKGDYRNRTTEIYDSASGYWKASGDVPKQVLIYSGVGAVFCRGSLYCPTEWPHGLLAFNLETEEWNIERSLPSGLLHPYVMDCDGGLFLAGEVSRRGIRSVGVWKLDSVVNEWKQVEVMPEAFYREFKPQPYMSFRCIGKGHWVVFMTISDGVFKGLVFDICSRCWYWLPGTPSLLELAFFPRFDALGS